MNPPRILVAGIGNIFLGDDAFGVEVVHQLAKRKLPEGVRVCDFGIRGFDLAYTLLDGYDLAVLIDATPRGGAPGTLYTIEPEWNHFREEESPASAVDTHGMNPSKVLNLVKAMGGNFHRLLIVGCEPAEILDVDDERMGLSPPVAASVAEAAAMVEKLIYDVLGETKVADPRQ